MFVKILESKQNISSAKLKEFLEQYNVMNSLGNQPKPIQESSNPLVPNAEYVIALEKRIFSLETILGCISNTLEMEGKKYIIHKNPF